MIALATARFRAEKVREALAPFCERIEVAGSVRRARPFVNDLDFVVLATPYQLISFRQRASAMSTVVKSGDDIYIIRQKDGLQIDFYFARGPQNDLLETKPGNWGTVMLCRTGSKEHNIHLAQQAQRLGYKWETMLGVTLAVDMSGRTVLASETEEDIFKALEMDFIQPEDRER